MRPRAGRGRPPRRLRRRARRPDPCGLGRADFGDARGRLLRGRGRRSALRVRMSRPPECAKIRRTSPSPNGVAQNSARKRRIAATLVSQHAGEPRITSASRVFGRGPTRKPLWRSVGGRIPQPSARRCAALAVGLLSAPASRDLSEKPLGHLAGKARTVLVRLEQAHHRFMHGFGLLPQVVHSRPASVAAQSSVSATPGTLRRSSLRTALTIRAICSASVVRCRAGAPG